MATLTSAKNKYRQSLAHMPANYNEGVGEFLGIGAGAVASSPPGQAYAGKMRPGLEEKWERRLRQAFSGGAA